MGKKNHDRRDKLQGGPVLEKGLLSEGPLEDQESGRAGSTGTLYIVATPIGNLEDITIRAIRILKEVSLIAAEDTRHTRILLDRYEIPTPLTSLHDWNEANKSVMLLAKLQAGENIAYVSDAGTPGISDPGYILVRNAVSRGFRVAPIPGSSALVSALSVSGLPMDSFIFLGFLPAKPLRRREVLTSLRQEKRTLIFYESPHRLLSSLHDIDELLGGRDVVVSREMTKIYEEFLRGPAAALIAALEGRTVKGEVTLVVAGLSDDIVEYSDEQLLQHRELILQEEGGELSLRDMAGRIAAETGATRKRIYRLLLSQ
jgi:16S rRNA (cytidine1402-2'-O)-methyltransferase